MGSADGVVRRRPIQSVARSRRALFDCASGIVTTADRVHLRLYDAHLAESAGNRWFTAGMLQPLLLRGCRLFAEGEESGLRPRLRSEREGLSSRERQSRP